MAATARRTVVVTVPSKVANDLKAIQKIQAEVVGRLGHAMCYSGFDILFREETVETNFSVNAAGHISEVARAGG